LTYRDAQSKLLALVRDRIQNGELTERGLARRIGISQPHVHNVLKGVRNLSPEIFDSMLEHFQMSLLDLAAAEDLEASLRGRRLSERTAEVAFLVSPIGPEMRWPTGIDRRRSFPLPFPSVVAPPDLVMTQLAADPDMPATIEGADIALLDLSEQRGAMLFRMACMWSAAGAKRYSDISGRGRSGGTWRAMRVSTAPWIGKNCDCHLRKGSRR